MNTTKAPSDRDSPDSPGWVRVTRSGERSPRDSRSGHQAQNVSVNDKGTFNFGDRYYKLNTINQIQEEKGPSLHDVLQWLPCSNYRAVYDDHCDKLYEGTGRRQLESKEFRDWYEGRNKWLWCHGMPGAGKTAFATVVLRHIQEAQEAGSNRIGLAYLYCNHLDTSQSALLFVSTMLHQLVEQSTAPSPKILSFYQKHTATLPPRAPRIEDYERALRQEISRFDNVYVVVDALDECKDDDNDQYHLDTRSRLVQTFKSLGEAIHLFITSRDKRATGALRECEGLFSKMKFSTIDEDIMAYVNHRINIASRLNTLMTPDFRQEIQKAMVEKAAGIFLPAQLYMTILAKAAENLAMPRTRIRQSLRDLPSFSDRDVGEGYQSAYQEILKNIWAQRQTDVNLARTVLSWVIFTKEPMGLTLSMVRSVLSLENDAPFAADDDKVPEAEILSICRGLLKTDQKSGNIRFVHYSTETYFASTGVLEKHFENPQEQLARTCLKCLLSAHRDHPLYEYASQHWGHHAQHAEGPLRQELQKLLHRTKIMVDSFKLVICALPKAWEPRTTSGREKDSLSPLHVAAYFDLRLTAMSLLDHGADVESTDRRGWTPMWWAIIGRADGMVNFLFGQKASLLSVDLSGEQAVFWAANSRIQEPEVGTYNICDTAQVLIADVRAIESKQSSLVGMVSAVEPRTSWSVFKFLLNNIPNVEVTRVQDGRTILSIVAHNWQWNAVELLLRRGADVNSKDLNLMTPLLWALQPPRRTRIYNVINVANNARLCVGNITTIGPAIDFEINDNLIYEQTDETMLCRLIGQDLEPRDMEQRTPLCLAAENRFCRVMRRLIDGGADPNASDSEGMTPLHYACSLPCFETVVIRSLSCQDDAKVCLGTVKMPQISVAKSQGKITANPVERAVELLLLHGARRDAENHRGLTALALAIFDGLESVAALLQEPRPRRSSFALNLTTQRPTIADTTKGDGNNDDGQQKRDYAKVLLAMLHRRSRFQIHFISITGRATLLVSSTSDIFNLTADDQSQILITDKPHLEQLLAHGSSVVIIRAAATIVKLISYDTSCAFIYGFARIKRVTCYHGSCLTAEADTKIDQITTFGQSLVTFNGRSRITQVMGHNESRLTAEADTKIDQIMTHGRCSVRTKGRSVVEQILGYGDSSLVFEADAEIASVSLYERGLLLSRGNSNMKAVDGYNQSMLVIINANNLDGSCISTFDSAILFHRTGENFLVVHTGRIETSGAVTLPDLTRVSESNILDYAMECLRLGRVDDMLAKLKSNLIDLTDEDECDESEVGQGGKERETIKRIQSARDISDGQSDTNFEVEKEDWAWVEKMISSLHS